jgi:hypothetical protein
MNKRKNFEVVLSALIAGEDREFTLELPDGLTYGWHQNKLCNILNVWTVSKTTSEPDETWVVASTTDFNSFVELCDQIPDDELVNIIFQTIQMKEKLKR